MKEYASTILKDDIANLDIAATDNRIVVVDRREQVDEAIAYLRASELIGFDTETKPSFQKGEHNTVSLLQLAADDCCFLFRLKQIGQNRELKNLLEDSSVLKVGLSVLDDFRALNKWMEMTPNHFIELQRYVKAFGIEENSLQKIYAIIFGKKISKKQQLSNWESPSLGSQQQLYAATDAWACRQIYLELKKNI